MDDYWRVSDEPVPEQFSHFICYFCKKLELPLYIATRFNRPDQQTITGYFYACRDCRDVIRMENLL